ncbi:MAG: DUF4349 domain-containing protein [Firmicutes bacterium]|nr:DUF4349 domain-containing protein [Bacillota bacterium]
MRKAVPLFLILVLLLILNGCGGASNRESSDSDQMAVEEYADEKSFKSGKEIGVGGDKPDLVQKIIKNVSMNIAVPDVEKAVAEIELMLQGTDGYVQDANLWQDDNRLRGHLTLRVPSNQVDGLIPRLEKLGRVERKDISGQDVTEEYYDVQARKNNLEKQEGRYLELLDKADTVKEMLEIENELFRVRGEIESMEARLKVLDNKVNLSTIRVELRSPGGLSTGERLKDPFDQRIQAAWLRGVNGMISSVQGFVVLFVALLPYTPMVALVGYVVYRVNRNRRQRKVNSVEKQE